MPSSVKSKPGGKQPRPVPDAAEQIALRAALETMRTDLLGRAGVLARGLRPPPPAPDDLVNETVKRMLRTYKDDIAPSARPIAFTVLARLVCDIGRGYRFDAGVVDEDVIASRAGETEAPRDPMFWRVIDELSARERMVLELVAVHGQSVMSAFAAARWEAKSPFYEFNKLLERLRKRFGEDAR
jgi:DNA-directed RNA polymerase specialized sigma24 family protein